MITTEFPYLMISRAGELRFRTSDVVTLDDIEFFNTHKESFKRWDEMSVFDVAKDPVFEEIVGRAAIMENGDAVPPFKDIDILSLPVLLKTAEVWLREVQIRISKAGLTPQPE